MTKHNAIPSTSDKSHTSKSVSRAPEIIALLGAAAIFSMAAISSMGQSDESAPENSSGEPADHLNRIPCNNSFFNPDHLKSMPYDLKPERPGQGHTYARRLGDIWSENTGTIEIGYIDPLDPENEKYFRQDPQPRTPGEKTNPCAIFL